MKPIVNLPAIRATIRPETAPYRLLKAKPAEPTASPLAMARPLVVSACIFEDRRGDEPRIDAALAVGAYETIARLADFVRAPRINLWF